MLGFSAVLSGSPSTSKCMSSFHRYAQPLTWWRCLPLLLHFLMQLLSWQSETELPSVMNLNLAMVNSSESCGKKYLKCQHCIHPSHQVTKDSMFQSFLLLLHPHPHPLLHLYLYLYLFLFLSVKLPILESEYISRKVVLKVLLKVSKL